jgi:PAS domain S-box-containing protein
MQNINNPKNIAEETGLDFQSYIELPNNNPLVIVAPDLKIVYSNEAFHNNFGLEIGQELFLMKSNPEFLYLLKGFSSSHYKNITLEINLSSDNNDYLNNYSVSIERIVIRSIQYFVLIIESLENRKKIEQKINSLHNALDRGNVPIIILDHDHRVTYATRSFEELIGKDIDSIYNHYLRDVINDVFDNKDIKSLESAMANFLSWKKVIPHSQKRPTQFWEYTLNPVKGGEDYPENFILLATNLTEHIEQSKMIERSERKQKMIINNISDMLLIVESTNNSVLFENANDNFCQIFGLDKNKIYSLRIEDFIPEELVELIYKSMRALAKQNTPYYEFNYKHADYRQYTCKITRINETERNSAIHIITMKDITEEILSRDKLKKAILKEIQLNKMKSDFLANMSHEIRTPFNAVVGFSEIIDESVETGNIEIIRELMDSMKEVLGRALNLFMNITEVSVIESGDIEFDMVDLNCNQILRNVYHNIYSEAEKKKLNFILDLAEEECTIEIDWVKLEKVIYSLVDNSIKYTVSGNVQLTSRLKNDKVEIIISDTGVGIEQAQIERLLKPFTQEVEGYTRPFEGAGLGLTIAYRLTELMGGTFEINSQKNVGTTITIVFPLSK